MYHKRNSNKKHLRTELAEVEMERGIEMQSCMTAENRLYTWKQKRKTAATRSGELFFVYCLYFVHYLFSVADKISHQHKLVEAGKCKV